MTCNMEDRISQLGFVPQKELIYTKLLPYADRLDEDSKKQFTEIKTNLGRAVLLRDIRPGCIHWVNGLSKYLRLYGRRFSKEDHIALIHLLYDVITEAEIEFSLVQRFSSVLSELLKKKDLLTPDELELPWRPLYNLYEKVAYSRYEQHGLVLFPGRNTSLSPLLQELGLPDSWTSKLIQIEGKRSIENNLKTLIRHCRSYFPVTATQEMLDEWFPLLCPFDVTMAKALLYLELFLPTDLAPRNHKFGFKLWFTELMGIWQMAHSNPVWEINVSWLFSRLAIDNIGYIDWEPYIPMIFTKFLRSFNLPVGSSHLQIARASTGMEIGAAVNFIVAMLGSKTSCQSNLSSLFKALESYYHPSNNGRWNMKLQRLLYKLPATLVKRINKERYRKLVWETPVPESYKLTDGEITEFVNSILPCVLLSMFSKLGSSHSASALQNLSVLRPELVIPPVLERLYPALETLTEPHRLISTMHCSVAIARSLVKGGRFFPEGPSHVIPLLMYSLPGLDPNDFKKCMVTFQFIFAFSTLVPLVDCSGALQIRADLTEAEQELCLATRTFEDFTLQFMDRCFALIEYSTLEHTTRLDRETEKMNSEEGLIEVALSSTFVAILMQCSSEIYKSALSKLHSFITGRILETKISGKFAANMCRCAAKVNPTLALKTFLPQICKLILVLTESEELVKEETLDNELLFNILLLSEIIRCDGNHLLPYRKSIMDVLQKILHLSSRQGYLLSGSVLRHLLKSLTLITPIEFRSVPGNFEKPFEEYLPIRDWGVAGDIFNLGLEWHLPSPEEKEWAQELLKEFLIPELRKIESYSQGKVKLTREELQQSLSIILDCVLGAGALLPPCEENPIKLVDCAVSLYDTPHSHSVDFDGLKFDGGVNIRSEVGKAIHSLLEYMLSKSDDDTKSLFLIIQVYHTCLFYLGVTKEDFDARWKTFQFAKKAMENKLIGRKMHIRPLLIDRTLLQHEICVLERPMRTYTHFQEKVLLDLFSLSTSHYSQVRSRAQTVLTKSFRIFSYSYRPFIPKIVSLLKNDTAVTHEEFKGALYILLGSKYTNFLTKHDWKTLNVIWPAVISAQHSEKPSVIKLMDEIKDLVQKSLETISITVQIPDSSLVKAKKLLDGTVHSRATPLTEKEINEAAEVNEQKNSENLRLYHSLVEKLVDMINSGELRWRHYYMALVMLSLLLRYDVLISSSAVDVFAKCLIHDSLIVRKIAINSVAAILKQQKRKHKKIELNPFAVQPDGTLLVENTINSTTVTTEPTDTIRNKLDNNIKLQIPKEVPAIQETTSALQQTSSSVKRCPGDRPDNQWMLYNAKCQPTTEELWNKRIFVNKTHHGFYCWPKVMMVYASSSHQPKLNRSITELSEEEVKLYQFFSQQQNIDKWVSFLSLEDRKGKDKFDAKRFVLFKGLFRNYGSVFLHSFVPHLERLVADTQESSQRCAAEIIAGIIRGCKHWPFDMVQHLKENLTPILKVALSKVTTETVSDWGTCFATASENGDPNRLFWVLELLLEDPMRFNEGSFNEASRLYLLQGGLSQQEWRVPHLLHRLLNYLKPYLTHPYQNVRVRLGSVLTNIFLMDIVFPGGSQTPSPKRKDLIEEILPHLSTLNEELEADSEISLIAADSCFSRANSSNFKQASSDGLIASFSNVKNNSLLNGGSDTKKAVSLMKTVCKWIIGNVSRALFTAPAEFFLFLPMICQLESNDKDDELKQDCQVALACFGQAYLPLETIQVAISAVQQISECSSWRARAASLAYLQVMIFSNLFSVITNQKWIKEIQDIVLSLLQDDRVEVREMAGVTLSGFLHCEFFQFTDELHNLFKTKLSKKLRSKKGSPVSYDAVIQRHAGILGMCAYVNAHPYDVPEKMPDIIINLGEHLNDPQPIPLTIKKTLSNFRRTHYDSWRDHKQKFSDDQLAVLTDLLVSPTYYA